MEWRTGYDVATLVVCGEDDRVTGMNVSQLLVEDLPYGSLLVIANAGHAPHVEQPDRFAQALREFIHGRENSTNSKADL